MARGQSKKFSAYEKNSGLGAFNNSTNTFSYALITDDFASVDANAATAVLADFDQVASAGNYVACASLTGVTWTQAGASNTLSANAITFAADPANPTGARCLLIYNNTSASDQALMVVDLTADGTTAVDTTLGFTANIPSGLTTITVNA